MFGRLLYYSLVLPSLSLCFLPPLLFAADKDIRFDVPAVVPASHVVAHKYGYTSSEKLIEVVIPATAQIDPAMRGSVEEFRFDVYWNRSANSVVDYGPRTQTTSPIEGLIAVEKRNDKNASIGFNVNASYADIGATSKAELSNKQGSSYRYQEIPQHDVLVASGTIKRGTGAFFRFHPSKKNTLEGGRDLVVAFRVPATWRGGILQVECRAVGEKKLIGIWGDPIRIGKSFVLPVFLEGDDQARTAAIEFAKTQDNLESRWKRQLSRRSTGGFKQELESLFGAEATGGIPKEWSQYLIQTGDDRYYEKYFRQLSSYVRSAALEFMAARQELVGMSR